MHQDIHTSAEYYTQHKLVNSFSETYAQFSRFRRDVEALMELRASWTSMGRTPTGFKQRRKTNRTTNYSALSEITKLQTIFSFLSHQDVDI
ncbi:hypothetical protein TNCV_3877881 [Trichonephila clavipes]|uniref:Uncharacterized protein n=1 Tax=Trichonephila clavipes TaxID=2585209 RepID=A0A8X6VS46_TRICX|nr:hypothetical protein TNCV_3877881 [Trichonephila clavipes]